MTNDEKLMQQAMAALAGYRREMNEHQLCDAERALEARLAQPEREWQGLTVWEKVAVSLDCNCISCNWKSVVENTEAKLKEKNGA